MFTDASPFSEFVDAEFMFVVGISLLVLLGVTFAMIYFVVRYSRKRNPHPTNIDGNLPLEIMWTVVPLGIFMYMFYLGWEGYKKIETVPEGALPITVTARMWAWEFEYPNGVKTDTLVIPTSTPMVLRLHSLDVNHSMYIPAFRIKKDVIPNRENTMWFETPHEGSFDIACAEYCGLRHAYMYTKVVAKDSTHFEAWYRETSEKQAKPYTPMLGAAGQTREE